MRARYDHTCQLRSFLEVTSLPLYPGSFIRSWILLLLLENCQVVTYLVFLLRV